VTASLERRYRGALDWYPSVWREANGEAMLGTLLDEAEATGREKPALGQTLNLFAFGLRERARTALPASVRDRASALAWGLGAAISTVMFIGTEWTPWSSSAVDSVPWHGSFGPFVSAGAVVLGLWMLAFVAAVAGAGAVGRWMLALTIPASVALVAFDSQPWAVLRPTSTGLLVLAVLTLLVLQGSPTASRRGRVWLLVCAVGSAGLVVPLIFSAPWITQLDWWIPRLVWGEVVRPLPYLAVLGGVVLVAAVARRYAWAGAALLLCVPLALYVAALVVVSGGAVPLVIGVAVAVLLAILVRRSGYSLVLRHRDEAATPPAA
jgi:hypothetical protein